VSTFISCVQPWLQIIVPADGVAVSVGSDCWSDPGCAVGIPNGGIVGCGVGFLPKKKLKKILLHAMYSSTYQHNYMYRVSLKPNLLCSA
jgi:hypothetical protein